MSREPERDLEELYRMRFDVFLRVAASITGDDAAAHDAVQDGFARALRSLSSFRGEAALETWVWRIVLNAARDSRRQPEVELADEATDVVDLSAPPFDNELAGWIRALPEQQRLMIFLRYAADLDYRGIAHVLGVRVGTVSATLHAAHERLRPAIEEMRR